MWFGDVGGGFGGVGGGRGGGESQDSRPVCQSVNKDKAVFIY